MARKIGNFFTRMFPTLSRYSPGGPSSMRKMSEGRDGLWKWYMRNWLNFVAVPLSGNNFKIMSFRRRSSAMIGGFVLGKGFSLNPGNSIFRKNFAVCLPPEAFSFTLSDQTVTEDNTQSIFVPYTFDKDESIIKVRALGDGRTHIIYVKKSFVVTLLRGLERVDAQAVLIEPVWFTVARSPEVMDLVAGGDMEDGSGAILCTLIGDTYELALIDSSGIPAGHISCDTSKTKLMDAAIQLSQMSRRGFQGVVPAIRRMVFLSDTDREMEGDQIRVFVSDLRARGIESVSTGFVPSILSGVRTV